jgi:1-aminocyclopropane-1-carboxylate deaminase
VHSSSVSLNDLADSPLQRLRSEFLKQAEIKLYVKRDDLIHPRFGGNKWRKLKYNLTHARDHGFDTLLTFGGAWSNHIYATAAAAKYFGFDSIGIIRGEEHTPLNATLSFAERCGMQLHYVTRSEYRQKHEKHFLKKLKQQFGDVYLLPEGGSNTLALKGCAEIVDEVNHQIDQPFDIICCASGTGATLAGLASALKPSQSATGFSVLKGGDFLSTDVENFLKNTIPTAGDRLKKNWHIETRYHIGGYARINPELIDFMQQFQADYGFELDAVYTGKMFYGLFDLIEAGTFEPGTVIVAVHSGGLQGNKGFNL